MLVKRSAIVTATTLAIVAGALFSASASQAATSTYTAPSSYSSTSTQPVPVSQPSQAITQKYYQMGGAYTFGAQTAPEYKLKDGSYRSYANGTIYWSPATGAWGVLRQVDAEYKAQNIAYGALGFPLSDETYLSNAVVVQKFQGGVITMDTQPQPYTPLVARAVTGPIAAKFTASGGAAVLGAATNAAASKYSGTAQSFKNGIITTSPTVGTYLISDKRVLGYWTNPSFSDAVQLPISDAYRTADGGTAQKFQNGYIYIPTSGYIQTGVGPGTSNYAPPPA